MAVYLVKCPSCGSATELNDEKEFGFCTECGTRIATAEAELFVPPAQSEGEAPAVEAPVPASFEEAVPAADAEPEAETQPTPESEAEAEEEPALPVYDGPELSNTEHLEHLIMHQPQPLDSVVFHSSDECAAYVRDLHALILDLDARYRKMNHAEEATCLDYLERGVAYCEYLDTRRMRFLAGTHEENGKTVEDYGTFPVSKSVLKEIKAVRERFVEAYNGFFTPKIAAAKASLDETKEKIRALPGAMRFCHSFCTPLMGILTAALFAVGLVPILVMEQYSFGFNVNTLIAVVGAVLFIAWVVTTVLWVIRGGSARQLYKAAERQVGEIRAYRGKLKS